VRSLSFLPFSKGSTDDALLCACRMSVGKTLSKAEMQKRREEEVRILMS
jgi:hypothetical protein